MKLSEKEKSYIYDRVKWYGYNLGSTKDFTVKLYFFRRDDYLDDLEGKIEVYYSDMNTLFNILANRGITYKEYFDEREILAIEFSSKEIFKYIKYDINRGKKKRKLTPLERRLERESDKRIEEFLKNEVTGNLEDIQPFITGKALFTIEEGIEVTPYEEVDIEKNSIAKRIVDNVSKELGKIKDKYFPHEEEKKEYHIEGNITIEDNEEENPESAEVKVKMNPEDAMLAYIKGLAEFRKRQTGEDIRVVNEEGEEL